MKSLNGLNYVIGCLLSLALSATAHAGDLELGMQLLEAGQTEQAIEVWRPLAKSGNVDAQFGLGVIYNDAMGVPQDYIEANYWFLRAAEQGNAPAQFNLGNAYKNGTGMTPDASMAVIWWRKSAEQDFGPAQYNLGTAYIEGVGVPRDKIIGAEWYQRAAANGHPLAQAYLDEHATPNTVTAKKPTVAVSPASAMPTKRSTEPTPAASITSTNTTDHNSIEDQQPVVAAPTTTSELITADTSDHTQVSATTACSEWLMQGMENGYSIQLMSNRELSSSTDFIRQHGFADAVVCSYRVKNRLWHAVFHGQYATAREARAALAGLSAEVRAGGAYPRRLREIRDAIESSP